MNVTSVNATTGPETLSATSNAQGTELGKDDFLLLLVEQLKHQDPLNPQSNEDFIAQLAQMSSYEQIQNLNDQFKVNAGLTSIATGASLIGKEVEFYNHETEAVEKGVVDQIHMEKGEFVLGVDGKNVPLASVVTINEAPQTEEDAA